MLGLFRKKPKRPSLFAQLRSPSDEPPIPVRDVLHTAWNKREDIKREAKRLFREGPETFRNAPAETRRIALGLMAGLAVVWSFGLYEIITPVKPPAQFNLTPLQQGVDKIQALKPQINALAPDPAALAAVQKAYQQKPGAAAPSPSATAPATPATTPTPLPTPSPIPGNANAPHRP